MEEYIVSIRKIEQVTHDVKRFVVDKPDGYSFIPGQATEVSVNKPELKDEKRPFTFTCLKSESYLEFTIKIYPSHHGVTDALGKLKPGDNIIIRDVWGAINYKGKGVFIAGGAGVTPFISILRDLHSKSGIEGNMLIFANKTKEDIILKDEFQRLLGSSFINILSEESSEGYHHGFISESFLKSHISGFDRHFYVCGPPPMLESVLKQLENLNVGKNSIVLEI